MRNGCARNGCVLPEGCARNGHVRNGYALNECANGGSGTEASETDAPERSLLRFLRRAGRSPGRCPHQPARPQVPTPHAGAHSSYGPTFR